MRFRNAWIALALMMATAVIFAESLENGFVNFDDDRYVFNNQRVRQGLSISNIRWAAQTIYFSNWHPLTWLSYELDTTLFGREPRGYHATNVALHCVNSGLLFYVLCQMTGATGRSAVVAAIFALHPLHVESVAWIAERKDVLSGLFFMLTLWAYSHFARGPTLGRYLLVASFFAMGLMAKPMLVTMPFLLLLLDFWPLDRWPARRWSALLAGKLPLLLLSIASSGLTFLVQQNSGAMKGMARFSLPTRLVNVPIAYAEYLSKTFWPVDLAVYYPHPQGGASVYKAVAATVFLLVTCALAVRLARRAPYLAVGWFWWLGMLVPVIGLLQVGEQAYADRYMYLPLTGLAIAAVWGGHDVAATRGWPVWAAPTVAAVALIACLPITQRQIRYWHDSTALWQHAVDVTAANPVAFNSLGVALAEQGRLDEACQSLQQGIASDPADERCHLNLALVLLRQNRTDDAVAEFRAALRANSLNAASHYSLGVLLVQKGETELGEEHLLRAVEIDPNHWRAHVELARAFAAQGQFPRAEAHAAAAKRINPELGATVQPSPP